MSEHPVDLTELALRIAVGIATPDEFREWQPREENETEEAWRQGCRESACRRLAAGFRGTFKVFKR